MITTKIKAPSKAIKHVSLDIPVFYLEFWKKDDLEPLPPNQTFELTIDYPIAKPIIFKIKTGKKGLGLLGLLVEVGKAYRTIYRTPDKYGIWGHAIEDLVVEGISVDYDNKTIGLLIGS